MGKCGKKTEAMRGQTIRDSGYQPPWSVLSECTGQGKNWGQEWHRLISRVKVPSGCRVEPDLQQDHLAVEIVTVKEQRRCLLWTQGNRYVIYCISDYTDAHELQPVKWQCQSLNPTENVQEGKLLKSLRVKKLTMKQRRRGNFIKRTNFNFVKVKMRQSLRGWSLLIPKLRQEIPSFSVQKQALICCFLAALMYFLALFGQQACLCDQLE